MVGDWTTSTFGYPHEEWDRAEAEMRTKLVEVATRRGVIAYSELAKAVAAIRNPLGDSGEWSHAFNLLGQIWITELNRCHALYGAGGRG